MSVHTRHVNNPGVETESSMAVIAVRTVVLLTFLAVLWTPAAGGGEETCVFNASCILPCGEEADDVEVIHWHHFYEEKKYIVHSYFKKVDHLENQDRRYKNRTSLVEDRNTKRRTSLRLMRVQIRDQGRYECYTSNSGKPSKSYVTLHVDAPVDSVSVRREGNSTTCSAEGIYPQPQLTWSTEPPSNVTPRGDPAVQQTEDQLYSITSSLTLSDGDRSLSYSCNVSTRSNWRKVTPRQYFYNGTNIEIPCRASSASSQDFSLIWRYNRSEIIVSRTLHSVADNVSDQWKQQVKEVSESGNLILQNLTPQQGGIYTCELRQAGNGLVTENWMLITQTPTRQSERSVSPKVRGIVVAVVLLIYITVVGLIISQTICKTRGNPSTDSVHGVRDRRRSAESENSSSPEATSMV